MEALAPIRSTVPDEPLGAHAARDSDEGGSGSHRQDAER